MTVTIDQPATHCMPAQQPRQSLWRKIYAMIATRRQRKSLKTLDAHMLDDIGITRADAHREAAKPLWDVPSHWLQ